MNDFVFWNNIRISLTLREEKQKIVFFDEKNLVNSAIVAILFKNKPTRVVFVSRCTKKSLLSSKRTSESLSYTKRRKGRSRKRSISEIQGSILEKKKKFLEEANFSVFFFTSF